MKKITTYLPLILILTFAQIMRSHRSAELPAQIHVDELSNIYDGYSLAETGADRAGAKYPAIIHGYGNNDQRPPLYVWLCAVSIKFLGPSVAAGRLPSVLFGTLSLLILFLTVKKIGGPVAAYAALTAATLSPWHIAFSRIALESAILPSFFIILTVFLFINAYEKKFSPWSVGALGFCIGAATNDYQSMKLIFLIIAILVFVVLLQQKAKIGMVFIFILATGSGASPQIYAAITEPQHFFARAGNTMMPSSFTVAYFSSVIKNIFINLDPKYLFGGFSGLNNLTVTRSLMAEGIFFYLGFFTIFLNFRKSPAFKPYYIFILLFIAIVPSALTFDNPHALRTSCIIILLPFFSSSAFVFILELLDGYRKRYAYTSIVLGAFITNFAYVMVTYLKNPDLQGAGQQTGLVALAQKIDRYQHSFSKICIQDIGNQPYMYMVYYCGITPAEFRKMEKDNIGYGWDHYIQVGKFYFLERDEVINELAGAATNTLAIVKDKIPDRVILDSVVNGRSKFYFYRP